MSNACAVVALGKGTFGPLHRMLGPTQRDTGLTTVTIEN